MPSFSHFIHLNKIMSYENATRCINDGTLIKLEHKHDMMQDIQSSMTIRNVERGSCIVSTLSTTKILLQMLPRGNVETACLLVLTTPFFVKI